MSAISLMNQTLTLYTKSGYSSDGRETFGASGTVRCRFQATAKRRLLPNGSLLVIDGIVFVPPATSVNTDDKVGFSSKLYKVVSAYPVPDGQGNTNHIKLEVVKWQTT